MFFKIPTLVYQQRDCVLEHSSQLAAVGKKALIVTGRSSALNGALSDVKQALEKHGREYEIYDEVKENPPVEQVMMIRDLFLDRGIDFVIGLGGGSAIDCAKAVAVMLYFPEEKADFLYRPLSEYHYLPVVAVPTTCGTGSEVTGASVITRNDMATKQSISTRVYPVLALVDGKYLRNCPLSVIANTSIDALGHLIESYINTTATDYSQMITRYGLSRWARTKDVLVGKKPTDEDLDELMFSSTLAGMAIAHCGTSLPHGASYTVTYNRGIPHGKAVGYFLYGYLAYADKEAVRDILDLTGFANLEEFRAYLIKACDIRRLDDEVLNLAVKELLENKKKLTFCPYDTSEETIRKVIFSI